jgi:UDP-N-acetylglucosamine 2-epimerase
MKLLTVVGARPQFIKAAPVSRAIETYNHEHPKRPLQEVLLHTGQHYDDEMSEVFFKELDLPEPDYNLGVGSGTHGRQTGQMLERLETVLLDEVPDLVMVYGDTNSTLAGALAAAKLHIPVAHVEAGLRSYNRKMPEELNRLLTDHLCTLLLCPTETAVRNLAKEGIKRGVDRVGDVMYDSVLHSVQLAEQRSQILKKLYLKPKEYILATIHRAENTDDSQRLRAIVTGLQGIVRRGLPVILPLHPRTRRRTQEFALMLEPLTIIAPVPYLDMLRLEKEAKLILTDSGGVQKEACFLQVPCLTLREETEWVETVEAGWNLLVGADPERILASMEKLQRLARKSLSSAFGDGQAAQRIVQIVVESLQ